MAYFRPKFKTQKPGVDPYEPHGGEGLAVGNRHGWNGCTATSAALAISYSSHGRKAPWGGQVRHALKNPNGRRPGPLLGLDDILEAAANLGVTLYDWSGRGWDDVLLAYKQGRGIILQGTGDTPGTGTYKGPHAIYLNPDGVLGDPLASKWQKANMAQIKTWAQRLNGNVQFAVTRRRTS